MTDFHGTPGTTATPVRWSVTLVISAATIEDAARDGVELVIEAANAVDMPASDIATLGVTSASEQYRRYTAADHQSG